MSRATRQNGSVRQADATATFAAIGDVSKPGTPTATALNAAFAKVIQVVSDGSADQAARINAALGKSDVGQQKVVKLVGDFTIGSALTPTANTYLDLTAATITLASGANAPALVLSASGVTVFGGVIDGNKAGQTSNGTGIYITGNGCRVRSTQVTDTHSYGIWAYGANSVTIESVAVSNSDYIGIFAQTNGSTISDVAIIDSTVDRSMLAPAAISEGGLKIHGESSTITASGSRVIGCRVLMPTSPTDGAAVCIETTYAPRATVADNRTSGGAMGVSVAACDHAAITGNVVYNANGYGIEAAGSRWSTLDGNAIDGNGLTNQGIVLTQGNSVYCDGAAIAGNAIQGCATSCVYATGATGISLTSNTLLGGTGYMVNVQNVTGLAIDGNIINGLSTAQKGVMLDSTTRASVTGNTIRNTTQSGVLAYSSQSGFSVQQIAVVGNVFESTTSPIGTQVSNGATVASTIKTFGNIGTSEWLDLANQVGVLTGTAAPEASVYAGTGAIYLRQNGGQPETYIKGGAANTNTGWKQLVREDRAITGKVLTTGGIGVGNSAAATTLGTVTKRIEVFDASGTSLGFVPVYGSIT